VSLQDLRERADRLRGIPLEAVLERAGGHRDPHDPAKWHIPKGVLSVSGTKFMSWTRGVGGGGAIDLVIHLGDTDFKAAVEWLSRNFPRVAASEISQAPTQRTLDLPRRDTTKLPGLRQYLAGERRLPWSVIESLLECGSLYADTRGNAVFLLLGMEGSPVGAEIRGTTSTPWRGMAPGSRKDLGYFSTLGHQSEAIVLCESAIDAVSCLALNPRALCISTAGARPNPRWLHSLTESGRSIYCGFDSDPTGDDMARAMIAIHPVVQRLRPTLKDWNEVLKSRP
jgi:hypothetical protein